MQEEIDIALEGHLGVITLDRPKAINALSANMIVTILAALKKWAGDEKVRLVLLKGVGERGFCAGGDVRWTRDMFLAGRNKEALGFFELEYEMNRLISLYPKPLVALTHGVVMGGGIGLAGHAKFRISTVEARFGMPEAAIGFFCDVGSRSILARAPRHMALLFMLSGDAVAPGDAIRLGLSDIAISKDQYEAVRAAIVAAGNSDDVAGALNSLLESYKTDPGEARFCALADKHKGCFTGTDPGKIIERLKQNAGSDEELALVVKRIAGRCPTSHWANLKALDDARANSEIGAVLSGDLALARHMAPRGDFVEGIRAVLIDKDQQPKWKPDDIAGVDVGKISAVLAK